MAVEQAVDEVQVARPAAAGADGELAGQVRLGAGREGGDLLVPDMDPLDLAVAADGIGQAVQAVADDAVDPLDASGGEDVSELIRNGSHASRSEVRRVPTTDLGNPQQIREESRAAYAAEILVRSNLMNWNAAIYCTLVARDTVMVLCPAPWFSSTFSVPETLPSTLLPLSVATMLEG